MTLPPRSSAGDGFSKREVLELARQAYAADGSFPLERERAGLLVIDMQDEFVRPHWTPYWVPDATRLVPGIRRLIETCRRLEIPVLYTAFAATHHHADAERCEHAQPLPRGRIICGTLTNFCCGTTARQGYERGFNVVVPGDLTASDDRELHEAELKTLRKGFARILTLDEVVAELPQSGGEQAPGA